MDKEFLAQEHTTISWLGLGWRQDLSNPHLTGWYFIVIWYALMNLEFNVAVSQVWIKNLYFLK